MSLAGAADDFTEDARWLRSWLLAIGAAVLLSAGLLLLGVALVLAVKVPGSGLVWQFWRTPATEGAGWWLQVAAGAVILGWALRPVSERSAAGWLKERQLSRELAADTAIEIRRTRAWRTLPAFTGGCAGLGTVPAVNLAVALDPGQEAPLLAAAKDGWPSALTLALLGYLVGTVVAELRRSRPAGPAGGARLTARRPEQYLTKPARLLPDAVAGTTLAMVGVSWLAGVPASSWSWLLVVGWLVLGVRALQWWVVRRPQRLREPAALTLDDTLRSSVAHAVVGASCAGGLAVSNGLLDAIGLWDAFVAGELSGVLVLPLSLFGVGLLVATIVVWVRYGSGHPGARPSQTVTAA